MKGKKKKRWYLKGYCVGLNLMEIIKDVKWPVWSYLSPKKIRLTLRRKKNGVKKKKNVNKKNPSLFIYQPESARNKPYVMLMSNILLNRRDMNRRNPKPFLFNHRHFHDPFFYIPFPHFTNGKIFFFLFINFRDFYIQQK